MKAVYEGGKIDIIYIYVAAPESNTLFLMS